MTLKLSTADGDKSNRAQLRVPRCLRGEGQRAKMEVFKPPRGVNSPFTKHQTGSVALTMSRSILLRFRKMRGCDRQEAIFKDLDSIQDLRGLY
jgi:hypothetical protein